MVRTGLGALSIVRHQPPQGNGGRAQGPARRLAGLSFMVWARIHLGRNWSATVTLKENHELIRSGPYSITRHPIYTGDLLLLFGLELALQSWAVVGVAAVAVYVRQQAMSEERKLSQTLPGYSQYCRTTSRFVPFLRV